MIFTPNLIIGLGIMLFGGALMLDRLGVIEARELFTYWPVLLILFGASVIAQSFRRGDPAAPVPRPLVGPGFVRVCILVGAMLVSHRAQGRADTRASTSEDAVSVVGVMGNNSRASVATNFREADVTSFWGKSTLDLRGALVAPGETAVVDVFTLMGNTTILVPEGWTIDMKTMPIMGGVRDYRRARGAEDAVEAVQGSAPPPRVEIRGFVMMGKLQIMSRLLPFEPGRRDAF